jgi:hypothetical protein
MTWKLSNLNQILATFFIIVMSAGCGYYFGFKTSANNKASVPREISIQSSSVQINIISKEVIGVQWIKPNQEPKCDKDHKVKGKFNQQINYYYSPEYKNYERITPEICFSTEDFARDSAGFIKKF